MSGCNTSWYDAQPGQTSAALMCERVGCLSRIGSDWRKYGREGWVISMECEASVSDRIRKVAARNCPDCGSESFPDISLGGHGSWLVNCPSCGREIPIPGSDEVKSS